MINTLMGFSGVLGKQISSLHVRKMETATYGMCLRIGEESQQWDTTAASRLPIAPGA